MPHLPLEDIWVIDFTTVWAGPFTTRMLADFGANVIKLESLGRPDQTRYMHVDVRASEKLWNHGGYFHQFQRNKYGITLDLSQSRGKEILLQLVRRCDVFVENFAARVVTGLGVSYEELIKVKPDIIMLSLHGFGNTGPYRDRPAYGGTVEAPTGFRSLIGYGDGVPITPGSPLSDPIGSLHGVFAILSALAYREETGKGQFIDLSLHESIGCVMEEATLQYTVDNREPRQLGARHSYMAPHGFYQCKGDDSWVAICVTSDEEWAALCRVIGNPALAEERFSDPLSRWQNQDELDRLIEEWTIEHERYEAMNILQKAGVAAGACFNAQDILNDPHFKERAYFWYPDTGTYPQVGPVIKMSETSASLRLLAPALGEHNEYFLRDILGMSAEEIATLREEKIIGDEPAF